MAKPSMVTRTITTTLATILCLDIDSGEACNRTVALAKTYAKEKDIIKAAARAMADEPNVHPVHVVDVEVVQKRYGMTEEKFIQEADVLE